MAEQTVMMTIAKTYVVERDIQVPKWMLEPGMRSDLEEFLLGESQKMTTLLVAASDWADTTVTNDKNEEIVSWS
jgi:hypothetical protein